MKRKIPKKYRKGGVALAKAKEILKHGSVNGKPLTAKQKGYFGLIAGGKKMQTGGAPPTYQDKLNTEMKSKWQWEYNKLYNKLNDPSLAGYNYSEAEKAEMKKKLGALRGKIGIPEGEQGMWSEGTKSQNWNFNTGATNVTGTQNYGQGNIAGQGNWAEFLGQGDRVTDYGTGPGETFEDAEKRLKRKKLNPLSKLHQQDTSTIYTGEGDDLNPELEGGGFNKEAMSDPDSGLSKGIGAVAGLTGAYFDKSAGEDYAAREKKRDESVANVESVEGLSPLYLENQRAVARKKGQQDLIEGYDYVGHGAKSGAAKGAGMGAQVAGPWGALVGAAIGGIGGGLMGKSKEEGDIFAAAAQTAKDRKRLQGMQGEEISEIDPTKDEYGSVAAITVKKGGKVKMQNGGKSSVISQSKNYQKMIAALKAQEGEITGTGISSQTVNPLELLIGAGAISSTVKGAKLLAKSLKGTSKLKPTGKATLGKNAEKTYYTDKSDLQNFLAKFQKGKSHVSDRVPSSGVVPNPSVTKTPRVNIESYSKSPMLREVKSDLPFPPPKYKGSHYPIVYNKKGGKIKKQAGGLIKGPGTGTSDDIPGNLNEGDFVATAKNKNKALALRKQFGLSMQKANLQKGGKTMKKIPVKVSNGETLFTKKEIASMVKRGGGQVVDYLNSLAPEAEVPLQKGGTVQKDNSQEMINKYGGKKEDWYYGRYMGNDPLVKKKIEANKLEDQIKALDFIKTKEVAKTTDAFFPYSAGISPKSREASREKVELKKKLTSAKEDIKKMTNERDLNIQKERLNKAKDEMQNEINKAREQVDNAKTNQEVENLGKKIKELVNKHDKLKAFDQKLKSDYTHNLKNRPDLVKNKINDIMGVDEVAKQTDITEVSESDLGGAGVLKIKQTTKPIVPAKVTGAATQDASDIKKKQQAMVNAGYDLGTTGPNKDGVDGIMGPKTQTAWDKFSKEQEKAKDLSVFDDEAALYEDAEDETEEAVEKEEDEEVADKATEEAKREFPWSDLAGLLQTGMGLKGLAAMGQRPEGVKSADLAAQKARIDAAQSQFNIPIDETLRDIERTRIASTIPTTGERGYEFAKRSAATGQAMSNIQKAREQKAILEGQAKERFNLSKLGMQGQMARALAAEDRMLFQDDMQAFQQKQGAYAQLLQAGIGNFIKGKEARATRRSLQDLEGDVTVNIG